MNVTAIPERMRALILDGPNQYRVGETDVPRPGPFEVLCRVHAVAICGTDVHIIEGRHPGQWPKSYPYIPGHEWAGEVVALGERTEAMGWHVGDRVAGTSHAGCGYCRMCRQGRYNLCDNYGREDLGHRQYGHYSQGAYATYVVHSIKSVYHLPDTMTLDQGALVDTASIALWSTKRGGVEPGNTVAVVGAGPMGILVAQCAAAMGAARILMTGSGERLERSRPYCDAVYDYRQGDVVEGILQDTGGQGVDVAIDCAGTVDGIRSAVAVTRKGGRVVFTGVPHDPVALPMQKIVLQEIDLYGVRANRNTMEEVIPLIARGRIDVDGLITHRFPLERFGEAYETFRDRVDGALKVLVLP
jgi:L-iditol 2-dehydrogenase